MAYIVRFSAHIQQDLERGWSSWNFGKDGLNMSREELIALLNEAVEANDVVYISGFEVWPTKVVEKYDDIIVKQGAQEFILRELRENYWVVVDERGGLCFMEQQFETIEDAIAFAESGRADFSEGEFYGADEVTLVKSQRKEGEYGWHIFEI